MKAPFKLPVIANEELLMLNINGKLAAALIVGDVNNWDDEKRLEYLRYIAQAVNSHDALLKVCKAMKEHFWMIGMGIHMAGTLPEQMKQIEKQAEAVIAEAEKGSE